MRYNKIIIIAIVISVGIAVTTYMILVNPRVPEQQNTSWKTYHSDEYGFDMQYPDFMTVEVNELLTEDGLASRFERSLQVSISTPDQLARSAASFENSVEGAAPVLPYLLMSVLDYADEEEIDTSCGSRLISSVRVINGNEFFECRLNTKDGGDSLLMLRTAYNDLLYYIESDSYTPSEKATIDSILNTLSFIGEPSAL